MQAQADREGQRRQGGSSGSEGSSSGSEVEEKVDEGRAYRPSSVLDYFFRDQIIASRIESDGGGIQVYTPYTLHTLYTQYTRYTLYTR